MSLLRAQWSKAFWCIVRAFGSYAEVPEFDSRQYPVSFFLLLFFVFFYFLRLFAVFHVFWLLPVIVPDLLAFLYFSMVSGDGLRIASRVIYEIFERRCTCKN